MVRPEKMFVDVKEHSWIIQHTLSLFHVDTCNCVCEHQGMEEDVDDTALPARYAPATKSPSLTTIKEMEEMFLRQWWP